MRYNYQILHFSLIKNPNRAYFTHQFPRSATEFHFEVVPLLESNFQIRAVENLHRAVCRLAHNSVGFTTRGKGIHHEYTTVLQNIRDD